MAKEQLDLERLVTKEGRAIVVSRLIGKIHIPTSYIMETIEFFEKAGRFIDAAKLAGKAGLTNREIEFYERAGDFYAAALVAHQRGRIEKALENYERTGKFIDAAAAARDAGLSERADFYRAISELLI